jgi:pimeloyl-ACP methyl ester carboxylesterase
VAAGAAALAQETTVCVYDRAGLGWSDSLPRRRTARGMAGELHALLCGLAIGRPYVVAGHSLGGLVARIFLQLYPDEVAALALIDSSHPSSRSGCRRYTCRTIPAASCS